MELSSREDDDGLTTIPEYDDDRTVASAGMISLAATSVSTALSSSTSTVGTTHSSAGSLPSSSSSSSSW
eukprot:CAMPEP_0113582484 /NCGR_PEP_ID=MMETSP0015_2-20120614/31944_1 /TAXON_ID=2838 /ORGANISM="Odontella" /LENGTH=68 /DNA_ID=CAMNT_0000487169 /DNA_START=364 /DNA_END=567 /DNA_ORIENTATION=- /assembly_acc=CAM_ASM_000160